MANNFNTHTIHTYPSKKKAHLSRNEDGLVIAYRMGTKVAFGVNPNQLEHREFVDEAFAVAALRKIADADQQQIEQSKWNPPEGIDPQAVVTPPDFSHVCARIDMVDGEPRIKVVQ